MSEELNQSEDVLNQAIDWAKVKASIGKPSANFVYATATTLPKAKKASASTLKLERLSQEKWDSMDPKAKWDSIVALRGPDLTRPDLLKWFTTSVIRYRLGGVMRTGGLINDRLPFVVLTANPKDIGQFCLTHFMGHVYEAAAYLGIPTVYVSDKMWKVILEGRLDRMVATAMVGQDTQDPQIKDHLEGLIQAYYGHGIEKFLSLHGPHSKEVE
jgi:hypothetical protein